MNKSHLTAVVRKEHPVPVRWLLNAGMVHGRVLDFGCGKCKQINDWLPAHYPKISSVTSYDPHYYPDTLVQPSLVTSFDVVLCTYVLCVVKPEEQLDILRSVRNLLNDNGVAYITVRNDKPKWGYGTSTRGTFQRYVELPFLYELRKTRTYRIYLLTADTKLV